MITPRRQKQPLSTLSLCNRDGPGSLPIVPNQKDIGMKSDRALFRILHKQTLNTSGATKDRSMTEEAPTAAGNCPQDLRRSQTGITFGLRQSRNNDTSFARPHRTSRPSISGGFDHAGVHSPPDRIYVAHTANDSIDLIDCAEDRYVESIPGFTAVAGALVSKARGLVFTTNRGENTVSVFTPGEERNAFKIGVGIKPNGVAFDSRRGLLVVANVGDPAISNSFTASVVDLERRERIAEIKVPGRTRWAVYNPALETFFINIASPAADRRD
jgi:DNA-binding beta-propeller fold protein YncE